MPKNKFGGQSSLKRTKHAVTVGSRFQKVLPSALVAGGLSASQRISSPAPPVITVISIVLSIALVTLSWLQFNAATKQWAAADKASAEARDAKQSAEQARDEARKTIDLLRKNVRFMLERDYLTPKLALSQSDFAGAERVSRKLEEFAVPDEKDRRAWLESLKQRKAR